MKNKITCVSLALFILAVALPAKAADTGSFTFPKYSKAQFDNGLTVYLLERHDVPLIYISATFKAGSVFDGKKYGLADLTAESLMFGSGGKSKGEIEEIIDFHGASLGVGGGVENSSLSASFASKDADAFLPLIKDIILSPAFDEGEFSKYKGRLKVQLARAKESPRQVIGMYFNRFLYGDHPYGAPTSGTTTTVEGITLDDVKAFHKKYYSPKTSAIALVGDFNTEEMKKKLNDLFKDWAPADSTAVKKKRVDFKPFSKNRVMLINKEDSRQTTFLIGGWGVEYSHPDFVAISLVNTILGGRFTSWLNTELRIKSGLSYGARSGFNQRSDAGTFSMSSFTATPTTERALDLALQVMERLQKEGIDEETLRSGKNYMKGNFPRRYESPGSQVGFLTAMHVYGIDEDYINSFTSDLESVTPEKVKEVIKKYFPAENLQFVLAGKGSAIRELAKKYGEVLELDINDDKYLSK